MPFQDISKGPCEELDVQVKLMINSFRAYMIMLCSKFSTTLCNIPDILDPNFHSYSAEVDRAVDLLMQDQSMKSKTLVNTS